MSYNIIDSNGNLQKIAGSGKAGRDGYLFSDAGSIYTEGEMVIGQWINGKPLYRKCVLSNNIQTKISNPKMTSNSQDGYKITGSSKFNASYDYYYAFDENDSTAWVTLAGGTTSGWVQIEYPTPVVNIAVKIKAYYEGSARVKAFRVLGSNDGTNFTQLYSGTHPNSTTLTEYKFNNSTPYKYYRVWVDNNYTNYAGGISTIQFFCSKETEEADLILNGNVIGDYTIYEYTKTKDI